MFLSILTLDVGGGVYIYWSLLFDVYIRYFKYYLVYLLIPSILIYKPALLFIFNPIYVIQF